MIFVQASYLLMSISADCIPEEHQRWIDMQNSLLKLRQHDKIRLAQTLMHLEGISLDYVATKELIMTRCTVEACYVDEASAVVIRNVMDGLDFLETLDLEEIRLDEDLYIRLNAILAREQALFTGSFRSGNVSIDCLPDEIPPADRAEIAECLEKLENMTLENHRVIVPEVFCRLCRMQPFWDGNKRTASFLCNIASIRKNAGIFVLKDEAQTARFIQLLTEYYTEKNDLLLEYIGQELILSQEALEKDFCALVI